MEFEITTNLDTLRNQQITANFEAVNKWLDEELQPYTSMVVTEDAIPAAKTSRANLNKLKSRVEDYRKEAKKAALEPYNAFEQKVKVLTGKIDAAIVNIDSQVKAYEQREKELKTSRLYAEWVTYADGELAAYCPWNCVYNEKWANKTYPVDDAIEEIKGALERTKGDLAAIRDMGGDDTPALLQWYAQTHDLSAVVRKANELTTMRQREEQRKREAEERAAREANEKPKIVPQMTSVTATTGGHYEDENLVTVDFQVTCTHEQLKELGKYMKANGIKYGRVP